MDAPMKTAFAHGRRFVLLAALLALCVALCACPPAFAANKVNTGQLPDGSFIYEVEIADLAADSTYYDNQTVQITGEVVGDRINSEDTPNSSWITLSALHGETAGSVQVLVSDAQADLIDTYGRYGVVGSKVRIMGVFHTGCSAHEGLEDVHASDLFVVKQGETHPDTLDGGKFLLSLFVLILGAGVYIAYRRYQVMSR